ncbi:hypothetical protein IJV79_02980, partial [bacterium]|nr:hypothetical protein [bacterium]
KNLAYVSSPTASCLYVIDLNTMTLTQKIKLKGKCSKLTLTDNNRKIFYWDQKTNEIWSVELDNDYITQYIGSFPNISKIEYANGKVYLAARVAGRMAIVDYSTLNLITETKINEKPVDMLLYRNYLYILSASSNIVQVLDTTTDNIIEEIPLNTGGFSTKIYQIDNSNYALITDASANQYSIIDMDANSFVKNNPIDISVSKMIILPEVRKN